MNCGPRYMSLCSIPAQASRDGYSAPNGNIFLPFYGQYFFSGAQYTFPNSTVAQSTNVTLNGTTKAGTCAAPCGC